MDSPWKLFMRRLALIFCGLCYASQLFAFENFISREGSELKDGDATFRFIGMAAPEMHRIEDDAAGTCKADKRGWGQYFKWPTAEEQENWMQALAFTGHTATRIYVLSVAQEDDAPCGRETHILPPLKKDGMPRLNERAMVVYDRMIALAEKYKIRLILPFIDEWPWWGGRQQLAAFYDETDADFYKIDSKTFAAYKHIMEQIITRRNTVTGRIYRDEKAIMAWESGNEVWESPPDFTHEVASFVKKLDKNHLFVDGSYGDTFHYYALEEPDVDIISNHYYENAKNLTPATVLSDLQKVNGKKAYIIGEFGLTDAVRMQAIIDAILNDNHKGAKAAGGFVWSMRGHRHDGGFYYHLEGANNKTFSYHLPGFPEGDANEEIKVIDMVRTASAKINGKDKMAPLPKPLPPKLREITSAKKINWMGAAVGRSYRIERAASAKGPWAVIGNDVSDGKNKFDPAKESLFEDTENLQKGKKYFYRVIAINESGESAPSNVQAVVVK